MRWIKHMTATRRDEKIAAYLEMCGPKYRMEAYGFYWAVLECVAASIESGSSNCSASYAISAWSNLLGCHHHTVGKYVSKLASAGLLLADYPKVTSGLPQGYPQVTRGSNREVTRMYPGGNLKVTIPNLLKYRDEYSQRSGQTPASLPSKKQRQKQIQNTDTETPKPPPRQKQALSSQQAEWFECFWSAYWRRIGRGAAEKAFASAVKTMDQYRGVMQAILLQGPWMLQRDPDKRPYPATWLNQRRWEDDADVLVAPHSAGVKRQEAAAREAQQFELEYKHWLLDNPGGSENDFVDSRLVEAIQAAG